STTTLARAKSTFLTVVRESHGLLGATLAMAVPCLKNFPRKSVKSLIESVDPDDLNVPDPTLASTIAPKVSRRTLRFRGPPTSFRDVRGSGRGRAPAAPPSGCHGENGSRAHSRAEPSRSAGRDHNAVSPVDARRRSVGRPGSTRPRRK